MRKILLLAVMLVVLIGCSNSEINAKLGSNELAQNLIHYKLAKNREYMVLSKAASLKRDFQILDTISYIHKKPSYSQLKSHTVYITGIIADYDYEEEWSGTGFIVHISDRFTWIITNAHIAGELDYRKIQEVELYVGDTKKERVRAHVMRIHSKYDLALIMVEKIFENKSRIKGFATARPQTKVYLVGHHLGRPYTYGEGVFAGYDDTEDNLSYDIIQIPILFGNSGSAVFNRYGHVIGLIFAINLTDIDVFDVAHGLSVPSEILQEFLKQWITK